jgi:tetratricopeptide (TPR) repeat protein
MDLLHLIAPLAIAVSASAGLAEQCTPISGVQDHLRIARCLAAEGRLGPASEQIAQYREAHPLAADGAVAEAQLLLLENDLADAADVLNRIMLVHPHSIPAMTLSAELSKRMNNADKAEQLLIQCTKEAPRDAETWKRLGDFYLRKQPREAVSSFSRALKLNPGDALALAGRASAESDAEMTIQAARDFARALSLNKRSSHPNAMVDCLYAEFLSADGNKQDSIASYDTAIAEDSSLRDAYLGRAKARMALQQWDGAESDLTRLSGDPDYAISVLALLVKAYKGQGNLEKATEASQRLERLSSESDAARTAGHEIAYQLETAAGLMRAGDCDKAIQIDRSLLKTHPEAAAAYLQSGRCYLQLARVDEAETALRRYLEYDGRSTAALSLLGRTLLQAGKIGPAREQFNAALLIDPLIIEASLGLAACSIQEQKYDDAERTLRGILTIPGVTTDVHLMLAECLYKQNHPQLALDEVSRALAIDPSDPAALRMKAALAGKAKP